MVPELTYVQTVSCTDLTLVSNNMASSCEQEIKDSTSYGSDHFPIIKTIDVEIDLQERPSHKKWLFAKADWDKFKQICCKSADSISLLAVTTASIVNNNRLIRPI